MEDTSFAIHPEKNASRNEKRWTHIGSLVNFEMKDDLLLYCTNGFLTLCFLENDSMRVVMNQRQLPDLSENIAITSSPKKVAFQIEDTRAELIVKTAKYRVAIHKQTMQIAIYRLDGQLIVKHGTKTMAFNGDNEVICFKQMHPKEKFYGFGEKTGFLNKRGEKLTMWNSDVYAPHNPETDPLYQSIPFLMSYRDEAAYGLFFANTFRSVFDLRSDSDSYSFSAEGGQLDYYLFFGPTLKEIVMQYTKLTGRTPLPPKWALGYHQSRYSYESEVEVRELVERFQTKGIPLSAVHLDIHYMKGYRVFTFDRERFSQPKKLIADLKKAGIRTVTIVDPGVKVDPEYETYREGVENDYFCKYLEGNIYYGDVWPGKSAFPDFSEKNVREWWGEKHRFYQELGVSGIWNDMNEPAVFNETKTMDVAVIHENDGKRTTHRELHNLYGLFMAEATYEGLKRLNDGVRPFLLTRAGYSGIQRYAAVWTGDNRSFWEHLQMSIPMMLNLGLSGIAFAGADVGGFAHDCNGELLVRWMQAAMFMPFFRNHSAIESVRQEPWSFGEPYESIVKTYIQERYRWLPYFYTLFKEAEETGLPIMRPLFLEYEKDVNTHRIHDQFMVGDAVIVAPILEPNGTHRAVYLPEGKWIQYLSGKQYNGAKHHLIEAKLDEVPVFIKEGTIIPLATDMGIAFHLYVSDTTNGAKGTLYEDDGETFNYQNGESLKWFMQAECQNGKLRIKIKKQLERFQPNWREIRFMIHAEMAINEVEVWMEGKQLDIKKDKQNGITIACSTMI